MAKAVGIDLGTTTSMIAVLEDGRPLVIANAECMRATPSMVSIREEEHLIGQFAKRQGTLHAERTLYSLKRFIGRRYGEVTKELEIVPYNVVSGSNEAVRFKIDNQLYSPEELTAKLLRKLADDASAYLGEAVRDVVISVPANYNDSQRRSTIDAAQIAGLNVLRIINEPTATALAYGYAKNANETILIFDLGGGKLDVSVLDVNDDVFEVRATAGDTQLGGCDFDKEVVKWLLTEFEKRYGIELQKNKSALQRLTEAAENAKIELSTVLETQINLPFISTGNSDFKHLEVNLKRTKFNELTAHLLERCRVPLEAALTEAKITADDLDQVLLVGGSTRIPAVQELVQKIVGKREMNRGVNPDEAVAVGAAIQAGILTGELKEQVILDITPFSLELETADGLISKIVEQNSTIPTRSTRLFTMPEDNQTAEIYILQGESVTAKDKRRIGQFKLDGNAPLLPDRIIEVTFELDANGIFNLSARERV